MKAKVGILLKVDLLGMLLGYIIQETVLNKSKIKIKGKVNEL